MAHEEQIRYCESVRSKFPERFVRQRVLDAGSMDINGNNRYLFSDSEYVGIDVGQGRNVDVVCKAHEFSGMTFTFVITTEMLEHDRHAKESLNNLVSLLEPGGTFLMTCAGEGRPEHGTTRTSPQDAPFTNDFYRNVTEKDLREWLDFDSVFSEYEISSERTDLRFWGIKRKNP